jgi:hypothetical protein
MDPNKGTSGRKSLNPTRPQLIVCVVLAICLGLTTASQHPGGGAAGVVGSVVGSFLLLIVVLLVIKALMRLVSR